MSFLKYVFVVLFITFLAGCVSGPKRTPFTNQTVSSINDVELYNLVVQDEIRPAINISNVSSGMIAGAGGGALPALIGGMIDSSINKNRVRDAQVAMETFYYNTEEFNFRDVMAKKINSSIAQSLPFNQSNQPAEAILLDDKAIESRIAKLAPGQALAFTSTFYSFIDNSKSLIIESAVFVFINNKKPTAKKTQPIFFNRYVAISPSYGNGGVHSMKLWSDSQSKLYRETIESLTKTLATLITDDMKAQKDKYCGKPVKARLAFMGNRNQAKATQIDHIDHLIRVQDGAGTLYAIPDIDVSIDPKAKPTKCS